MKKMLKLMLTASVSAAVMLASIIGQTKCALFTNEMCKKKDFFSRQTKSV